MKRHIGGICIIFLGIICMYSGISLAQAPDTLWMKTYGSSGPEKCWGAVETSDGGFAIIGSTAPTSESYSDFYFIRTDEFGQKLWSKTYGRIVSDEGLALKETPDGGFILTGFTGNAVYLIRINQDGDSLWAQILGDNGTGEGRSIALCDDGGFVIAGWGYNPLNMSEDVLIIKTDYLGNELWLRYYGGDQDERSWSVIRTEDGGYAVAGWSESAHNEAPSDAYVIKTDSNGDSLWSMTYGNSMDTDEARSIIEIPGDGFAIGGKSRDFEGAYRGYIIRAGINGESIWEQTYLQNQFMIGHSLARLSDGGFILGGYEYYYTRDLIVRTDSLGDTLWTKSLVTSSDVQCRSVFQASDGCYMVAGNMNDNIYLAKLEGDQTAIHDVPGISPSEFALQQNYPNPFNGSTVLRYTLSEPGLVTISVYDLVGRKVAALYNGHADAGEHAIEWNADNVPSGIYFARISKSGPSKNVKMILLK